MKRKGVNKTEERQLTSYKLPKDSLFLRSQGYIKREKLLNWPSVKKKTMNDGIFLFMDFGDKILIRNET